MNMPEIDETKLPEVMDLIDKAAQLMELKDCDTDNEAKAELMDLQSKLRAITDNNSILIRDYQAYWSYTDLEIIARTALQHPPVKRSLTDEQIKEIILKLSNAEFDEASADYYLKVLEKETGLDNITDYIFNPDELGMDLDVEIDVIIEKILADRK